jgi:hypothetical protein
VPNLSGDTDSPVLGLSVHRGGVGAPHHPTTETRFTTSLCTYLLMDGGNVYDDLLTKDKGLKLMASSFTFGGIFGKDEIEESFNRSHWR